MDPVSSISHIAARCIETTTRKKRISQKANEEKSPEVLEHLIQPGAEIQNHKQCLERR